MIIFSLISPLLAQPQADDFTSMYNHSAHEVISADYAQVIENQMIGSEPKALTLWKRFLKEEDERALLVLAHLIVQNESKDWPNDYRGEFLWSIAPAALVSAKRNRIYPSVVLAQGILESGWGTSSLSQNHNNLFGVKGHKGKGSVRVHTIESVKGKKVRQWAYFKHFESWADSIAYHGRLLGSSHYYAFAKPIARDAQHYVTLIAPRYASQPKYAEYVNQIIEDYRLDRWDRILWDDLLQ